jgi:hypothetical protein
MGWNAVINFETRGLIASNLRDYECERPDPRDAPRSYARGIDYLAAGLPKSSGGEVALLQRDRAFGRDTGYIIEVRRECCRRLP